MTQLGSETLGKYGDVNIPLVVDLDGTLIYEDTTTVLLKKLFLLNPKKIGVLLRMLFLGKAAFKIYLASLVDLDVRSVRVNYKLMKWLSDENELGREIVLCSGAPEFIVKKFYSTLKIFSRWHSTTASFNLTGKNKAELLLGLYGFKGFDYVGNSSDDLFVWRYARYGVLVNVDDKVRYKAKKIVHIIGEYF